MERRGGGGVDRITSALREGVNRTANVLMGVQLYGPGGNTTTSGCVWWGRGDTVADLY